MAYDSLLTTRLLQVVNRHFASSLSKLFIHRLGATSSMTDLLYVDETDKFVGTFDKLQQAGKIGNLQQVCDVFGCACMQGRHWSVN